MRVFRIVKDKIRTTDLSGIGAFRVGGRWNSKGTYMLYTSENSSLAYLESLVHFEGSIHPPHLFIMQIEVDDVAPVYTLPDEQYPNNWMQLELPENKQLGDHWMAERAYLGVRVRSAVNRAEYNILLNPLFPRFYDLVKVISIIEIPLDERLYL
jgi:RES domain-containing protein